jgi:hypothetical protein
MARLSTNNGWRDSRQVQGRQQWQTQGSGRSQGGFNSYNSYNSGNRYDSGSKRESEPSPRYSEGSSRHEGSRTDERPKYDNPQSEKYGASTAQSGKYDNPQSGKYDSSKKYEEQSPRDEQDAGQVPASLVDAFEKKLNTVKQEMTTSLQETTSKENEKFDLIFSILIELQRRQAQLEESVRSLKTQLQQMNGTMPMQMGPQPQQGQPQQPQQGQPQQPQQQGAGSPSNGSPSAQQASSPMGQQQMCFSNGQMPMGQQSMPMVGADGSMQMMFAMNSPSGGNMMPQMMPVMMGSNGMMLAMQQQMPVQFVPPQDGSPDGYQWGGSNPQSDGHSPGQSVQQDVVDTQATEPQMAEE